MPQKHPLPYYAVIFTSQKSPETPGYAEMNAAAFAEATKIEGFLGEEGLRDATGFGVSVSYWASLEAIDRWRHNTLHNVAKQKGKQGWFESYTVRICQVMNESSGQFKV